MTASELQRIEEHWRAYVDRFRIDGKLHPMHQLKLEHTIRVAADARKIAQGMHWPEKEVCLAEAIGLFHDIARFPQFQQYRSFNDSKTIDHGDLGFQTLKTGRFLEDLAAEPRDLILHSVRYHNKRDLPPGLTAHKEKHLRLIRDADRLDIFFICWDSIRTGYVHDHPEIIMGLDVNGPPSEAVLAQFEQGGTIDYRTMKSMADRFVLQLSWIHDLSYDATKRLIRDRKILEKFIDVLSVKTDRLMRCFETTEDLLAEV